MLGATLMSDIVWCNLIYWLVRHCRRDVKRSVDAVIQCGAWSHCNLQLLFVEAVLTIALLAAGERCRTWRRSW